MMETFEKVKRIDERDKFVVSGFVREIENVLPNNNPFYNVTDLIIYLILAFYYEFDEWDPLFKSNHIKIDGNVVINTFGRKYATVFLKNICKSPNKYHWKFKIKKYDGQHKGWNNLIGIWKINTKPPALNDGQHFTSIQHGGYAFISSYAKISDASVAGCYVRNGNYSDRTNYGKRCVEGDIIEMYLDLKKFELSYSINQKDYGVAFNVKNTEYRAAVMIDHKDNAIELMH